MEDRKLKILFISYWYPNKYKPFNGIFVRRHAAANAIDCDVSVIFIRSDTGSSIEESVEDGVYTLIGYYKAPQIKILFFYNIINAVRYILLWNKFLAIYKKKKGKPDLINANIVYPVSIIATSLKWVWGVPYVITEHWSGYYPANGHYKGFLKKMVSRIGVAYAGAVITISERLAGAMSSLGLKNKYYIILNVVDPGMFKLKSAENSKAGGYFNFLHISSLTGEKNVDGILRTFKKFHAAHPLSALTIIWDEDVKEAKDRLTERFSEKDGIFLTGKKTPVEIAAYFQKSDAFILFSKYESLPCVMLESFCCGVPFISTRVGDVPQYINEKNGVLVDSENEEQLLAAMEKIYLNSADYKPAEIRNMVVDKVSPAAVSKQFTDIYKKVLEGH